MRNIEQKISSKFKKWSIELFTGQSLLLGLTSSHLSKDQEKKGHPQQLACNKKSVYRHHAFRVVTVLTKQKVLTVATVMLNTHLMLTTCKELFWYLQQCCLSPLVSSRSRIEIHWLRNQVWKGELIYLCISFHTTLFFLAYMKRKYKMRKMCLRIFSNVAPNSIAFFKIIIFILFNYELNLFQKDFAPNICIETMGQV